jgi:hypothetical protein
VRQARALAIRIVDTRKRGFEPLNTRLSCWELAFPFDRSLSPFPDGTQATPG